MNFLDDLAKDYQYLLSAIGSIGTMLAVMISIYLGYFSIKSQKPQIAAFISEKIILPEGENSPSYLTVDITNKGLTIVRLPLSFCCIQIPLKKGAWVIHQLDSYNVDSNIQQKQYPFKIEPQHSEIFFLSRMDSIEQTIKEIYEEVKIPLLLYFLKITIHTDVGAVFRANLSNQIKKEIRDNIKSISRKK